MMKVGAVLSMVSAATAGTVYHHFNDMTTYNFPVDAAKVKPHLHPALSVDTRDGTAWVSVVASHLVKTHIDGVPIPLVKPFELRVQTYVTGPAPPGQSTSGVQQLDLFLSDVASETGAVVFFEKTFPVKTGNEKIEHPGSAANYSLTSSDLSMATGVKAGFNAEAVVKSDPLSFDASWFLNRTVWYGQNKAGNLTALTLTDVVSSAPPSQITVASVASTVLSALNLGNDVDKAFCSTRPDACFAVGESDVTFNSPVVLA
eukprot:Hpha_TRINITY_DN16599_c3_g6::TRINITY_DN16599_c3_g6_i2::g.135063::m.135063/K09166/K09166; uncharacterized protein